MFACPADGSHLQRVGTPDGILWACPSCRGRAVAMPVLRRTLPHPDANQIWAEAKERSAPGSRACPICERAMNPVTSTAAGALDVCLTCQFVWFDGGQFERVPHVERPPDAGLPQEALERLARMDALRIRDDFRRRYPQGDLPPGAWELIPGVLGLPIEEDMPAWQRVPWVTLLLAAAILVVSAWGFLDPGLRRDWAVLRSDPLRHGGLEVVVSLFFHGGLFHVTSNIWFLVMFGDDVEDFLGHASFGLLLGVSALMGAVAHSFLGPRSGGLLGASAAISGVVVFYGLRFPQARLRYFRLFRWLTMPASLAVGFWAFSQLVGARDQISGASDVSYVAHIAGGLVGLWFWYLWRDQPAQPGARQRT